MSPEDLCTLRRDAARDLRAMCALSNDDIRGPLALIAACDQLLAEEKGWPHRPLEESLAALGVLPPDAILQVKAQLLDAGGPH